MYDPILMKITSADPLARANIFNCFYKQLYEPSFDNIDIDFTNDSSYEIY